MLIGSEASGIGGPLTNDRARHCMKFLEAKRGVRANPPDPPPLPTDLHIIHIYIYSLLIYIFIYKQTFISNKEFVSLTFLLPDFTLGHPKPHFASSSPSLVYPTSC